MKAKIKKPDTEQKIIESVDDLDIDLGESEKQEEVAAELPKPELTREEAECPEAPEESLEEDTLTPNSGTDVSDMSLEDALDNDLDLGEILDDSPETGLGDPEAPGENTLTGDDLDLEDHTPAVPPVDPIVADSKPKEQPTVPLTEETELLKDVEIDLDLDNVPVAPPRPEKVKKGRTEYPLIFDPEFPLDKIEVDEKYQVRVSKLENIDELAEIIRFQGQIEAVRIVQENDRYFLVSGFRRLAAIKMLEKKTIKAIVQKNLPHDEIMRIASGTNLAREVLSDADKLFSVTRFQNQNKTKTPREVGKIFGMGESTVFRYLSIGQFLAKHPILMAEFQAKQYPYNVFNTIYMMVKDDLEIPEEKIVNFLATKFELGTLNKKDFEVDFSAYISELRVKTQIQNEEADLGAGLEEADASPEVIAKSADKILIAKGKKAKVEDDTSIKSRKEITDLLDSMLQCFDLMGDYVVNINKIENFQKFVDTKKITKIQGCMAKFNISIGKLV